VKYYDNVSDKWGTNKALGDQGLADSHFANSGTPYDSVENAANQFGLTDNGGDGAGMLFFIYASVGTLCAAAGLGSNCHPMIVGRA
jgi:hypothetical protein